MKMELKDNNKTVLAVDSLEDNLMVETLANNRNSLQNVIGCHIVGVVSSSISALHLDHEALSLLTAFRCSVDIRPLSNEHYIELPITFPEGRVKASVVAELLAGIATVSNKYDTEFDFTLSKPITLTLLLYNFCNNNNDIKSVGIISPKLTLDITEAENIITTMSNRAVGEFLAFNCSANVLELRVTPTRITVIKSSNYTMGELLSRSMSLYTNAIQTLNGLPEV